MYIHAHENMIREKPRIWYNVEINIWYPILCYSFRSVNRVPRHSTPQYEITVDNILISRDRHRRRSSGTCIRMS